MENHLDINSQFTPYNLSLKLKELGFDEECFGFYNNADGNVWIKHLIPDDIKEIYTGDISAPLYQQAFRWFREKYNLICKISSLEFAKGGYVFEIHNIGKSGLLYSTIKEFTPHLNTYEEAELECLKKLIEMVENK